MEKWDLWHQEAIQAGVNPELAQLGRMVFNAVCGSDDDHPRNHAVVFRAGENRWRLSPAFDVVPNPDPDAPAQLSMQLALGRTDVTRETVLGDAVRFEFTGRDEAANCLDQWLQKIEHTFPVAAEPLDDGLRTLMSERLRERLALLSDHVKK